MNENTIVILIFSGMLVGLACLASVIADKQRERECKDCKDGGCNCPCDRPAPIEML